MASLPRRARLLSLCTCGCLTSPANGISSPFCCILWGGKLFFPQVPQIYAAAWKEPWWRCEVERSLALSSLVTCLGVRVLIASLPGVQGSLYIRLAFLSTTWPVTKKEANAHLLAALQSRVNRHWMSQDPGLWEWLTFLYRIPTLEEPPVRALMGSHPPVVLRALCWVLLCLVLLSGCTEGSLDWAMWCSLGHMGNLEAEVRFGSGFVWCICCDAGVCPVQMFVRSVKCQGQRRAGERLLLPAD